jgi:uncharacterized protein YciI
MAYFHLRLEPPRPTFPFDGRPEEMDAMARHVGYWSQQAEAGVAIAVGPVFEGEGAWGMAIIEAPDAGTARQLADQDPIIQAELGFRFIVSPIKDLIQRPARTRNND